MEIRQAGYVENIKVPFDGPPIGRQHARGVLVRHCTLHAFVDILELDDKEREMGRSPIRVPHHTIPGLIAALQYAISEPGSLARQAIQLEQE